MARRFGIRGLVRILVTNLAGAGIDMAEWDLAVRELTAAREDSSDELAANQITWSLVTIATWRGEDVSADVARLTAWGASLNDSQGQLATSELRAQVAFAKGDGRPPATSG